MRAKARQSEYKFDLSGGNLSLDFANTVSRRSVPERRTEHLESYDDLIAFVRQSQVVSQREEGVVRTHSKKSRDEAARVLRRALGFREALYRAFSGIVAGKSLSISDLAQINQFASEAASHRVLTRVNGKYGWRWSLQKVNPLEMVLWPIALSATDLLSSDEVGAIRQCEAEDCDWLFLDNSRNHSRRWCEMKTCGNRAKARRHYQRSHGE